MVSSQSGHRTSAAFHATRRRGLPILPMVSARCFLNALKFMNPGVIRFLNLGCSPYTGSNQCGITTWASRRALGSFTWFDTDVRANIFCRHGHNIGQLINYTITSYTDPVYGGSALSTRRPSTFISRPELCCSRTMPTSVTFSGTNTVNWGSAHGFAGGENHHRVLQQLACGDRHRHKLLCTRIGHHRHHIPDIANAGQRSARGSQLPQHGGNTTAYRAPTLSMNGHVYAIRFANGSAMNGADPDQIPVANTLATMVYDADLNSVLMFGGSNNQGSAGLQMACPLRRALPCAT